MEEARERYWASQFTCDQHGNMGEGDLHQYVTTKKTCLLCESNNQREVNSRLNRGLPNPELKP